MDPNLSAYSPALYLPLVLCTSDSGRTADGP
jgi:hypothetical protein